MNKEKLETNEVEEKKEKATREKIETVNETVVNDETKSTENKGKAELEQENKTEQKETNQEKQTKPGNTILKILRITTETIIWICIALLVFLIVMSTVSKKTDVLGRRLYVIMSGSMEPTIMTKQAIITEEVKEPQVGDIIAFGKDDFITVHRIIKVYTEGDKVLYQTKGDNNNAEDKELVSKDIIKGKVKYILPGVGEIILFLQQHLILLVVAIGALIIIIVIRRLIFQ